MTTETDPKPLTTTDAEAMPEHSDEDGAFPDAVLVDRADLIATTRALEKEARENTEARRWLSVLHDRASESMHMHTLGRHEYDCALARINALAIERDAARASVAELVEALERFVEQGEGCPACGMEGRTGCGCRQEQGRAALAKARAP